MIIQGDNLVIGGNTVNGANMAKIEDVVSVDANSRVSTIDMIATQSFRIGDDAHWKIRPNNSNQELCFEYGTSNVMSDANIKARFNSSGHLLNPNQPVWYGAQASPANQRGDVNLTQYGARGGMAVSSSSRVTVPVAGYYLVSWSTHTYNDYTDYIGIFKNGGALVYSYVNNGHSWNNISMSTVVEMAANDYITFKTTGSSGTYTTDVGVWSAMHIHLIG
jgi:hypothetical protein